MGAVKKISEIAAEHLGEIVENNGGHTFYGGKFGFDYVCMNGEKVVCSGKLADMLRYAEQENHAVAALVPVRFAKHNEKEKLSLSQLRELVRKVNKRYADFVDNIKSSGVTNDPNYQFMRGMMEITENILDAMSGDTRYLRARAGEDVVGEGADKNSGKGDGENGN